VPCNLKSDPLRAFLHLVILDRLIVKLAVQDIVFFVLLDVLFLELRDALAEANNLIFQNLIPLVEGLDLQLQFKDSFFFGHERLLVLDLLVEVLPLNCALDVLNCRLVMVVLLMSLIAHLALQISYLQLQRHIFILNRVELILKGGDLCLRDDG